MTDVGRPLEEPLIEILPAEDPVPQSEPVPVPVAPGIEDGEPGE